MKNNFILRTDGWVFYPTFCSEYFDLVVSSVVCFGHSLFGCDLKRGSRGADVSGQCSERSPRGVMRGCDSGSGHLLFCLSVCGPLGEVEFSNLKMPSLIYKGARAMSDFLVFSILVSSRGGCCRLLDHQQILRSVITANLR